MTNSRNHFKLPNPKVWRCNVHTLDNQGALRLKVYRPRQETIWIDFKATIYFEGSMSWQSAQFHIADPGETLGIIRSLRNERFRLIRV